MSENTELDLAYQFINTSDQNIYLSGKAGTGKTTFLRSLRTRSNKRMIVVAPTGVAAINAGGVTIHSFFQLPFGPILPDSISSNFSSQSADQKQFRRFSAEKKNIIASLDLLVIDEISMVRADLLDGIDQSLRKYRNSEEPFGGVQLLLIGDMQQLPPVVKEQEWQFLSPYYKSMFFFSSIALKKCGYRSIELLKIYRQEDAGFISILNEIRQGNLSKESEVILNKKICGDLQQLITQKHIILTTHNQKAKEINQNQIGQLSTKAVKFEAHIEGEFSEQNYPTEEVLSLKEGAQVMFIKNDSSGEKKYFNGKIGTIQSIKADELIVKCPDDLNTITVELESWENIKYSINPESKEIEEQVVGKFSQVPLRLAWAITVHKSQGLTFDRAVLDIQSSFAHGQVYVALSRCRSLEGLYLTAPINTQNIFCQSSIHAFNQYTAKIKAEASHLHQAQANYNQKLLNSLYSFEKIDQYLRQAYYIIRDHGPSIKGNLNAQFELMIQPSQNQITLISHKFLQQIYVLLSENPDVKSNSVLQERIIKSAAYYKNKIQTILRQPFNTIFFESDNKTISNQLQKKLDLLGQAITEKEKVFEASLAGFDQEKFIDARAKSGIVEQTAKSKSKASNKKTVAQLKAVKNKELYDEINAWRTKTSNTSGLNPSNICKIRVMIELANILPLDLTSIGEIDGLGKKTLSTYGEELLAMVLKYVDKKGLDLEEIKKHQIENRVFQKSDTYQKSLTLFKEGKSIAEIADQRDLSASTIENHLAEFIESGEVKIEEAVSEKALKAITKFMMDKKTTSLKETKDGLSSDFSYGEIKLVQKHVLKQQKE